MLKTLQNRTMVSSAAFTAVLFASSSAFAGGNNFNSIAQNLVASIGSLPTLISAVSYLFGMLLIVLGVMKIKDHVENPTQTPLKDGAIRIAAGGGLFAIPILSEAALNTIGSGTAVSQSSLNTMSF